jgi:hypothetical protein
MFDTDWYLPELLPLFKQAFDAWCVSLQADRVSKPADAIFAYLYMHDSQVLISLSTWWRGWTAPDVHT